MPLATLNDIDRALSDWTAKLTMATDNLLELDDLLTYKRLRGETGDPPPTLVGVTKAKVEPAMQAVNNLWQSLQLIKEVIKQAAEMRKNTPRLFASDSARVRQIQALLEGPSIKLQAIETPLAQRSLLSASETERAVAPSVLLDTMAREFTNAKEVILAVDDAWKRLEPGLADAGCEASTLQQTADSLGLGALPEILAARQKMDTLRARVECDPLGTSADFKREIAPLLDAVRTRLNAAAQERKQVETNLTRARDLLSQLRAANQKCEEAFNTCRANSIETATLRPCAGAAGADDLGSWLGTLSATAQQGRLQAAQIGLTRWLQSAEASLAAAKAAAEAAAALAEMPAELKGRLSSLKVKARAYALRGAKMDASLDALAAQAEQLLNQVPTPVDRAAALVTQYETLLSRCLRG